MPGASARLAKSLRNVLKFYKKKADEFTSSALPAPYNVIVLLNEVHDAWFCLNHDIICSGESKFVKSQTTKCGSDYTEYGVVWVFPLSSYSFVESLSLSSLVHIIVLLTTNNEATDAPSFAMRTSITGDNYFARANTLCRKHQCRASQCPPPRCRFRIAPGSDRIATFLILLFPPSMITFRNVFW